MPPTTSPRTGRIELPVSPEAEAELERARKRLRRNGILIIAILDVLVVAVAAAGASDLRTMQTPQGTAGAWADAATGGDCARYQDLETPARRSQELAAAALTAGVTGSRRSPGDELCLTVDNAWRAYATDTSIVVRRVGDRAVVRLRIVPAAGSTGVAPITGELAMARVNGRWRVDVAPSPCPTPALTPARSLCPGVSG